MSSCCQNHHFPKGATSAPAEGPLNGLDFARHSGQSANYLFELIYPLWANAPEVTNVRANGATASDAIPQKIQMGIDDYLGHMDTDEMLEVTPGPLRLLKKNSKALKA